MAVVLRRIALLVTVVLTTALSAVALTGQPAAAVGGHQHHFNMCGHICVRDDPGDDLPWNISADIVVLSASSEPRPLSYSLNEVCVDQFRYIRDRLDTFGFTGTFITTDPNVSTCEGNGNRLTGEFGNALFTVGGWLARYGQTYITQVSGTEELRKALCVRFDAYAILVSCTSHMMHRGDHEQYAQYTDGQVLEYYYMVRDRYEPNRCHYAMGDFNVRTPWQNDSISRFYNGDLYESPKYWEADNSISAKEPTASGGPLDYVFADRAHQVRDAVDVVVTPVNHTNGDPSDHHHYDARFNFLSGTQCN